MYTIDKKIHDQAYQFFKQEAPEFLQNIETGLLALRSDRSTNNIHSIMRAAHSIKGGSASLNLEGIKTISHQLEDVFRGLYRFEGEIDADIEELLLQAYDCLRIPLLEQIQTGAYDEQSAIAAAEPIFEVLGLYFGDLGEDIELPTAAELGVDIVQIVFEGDVQQGILRLQNVLANPEGVPVSGEIRAQVEVFSGIGELLNLSGFCAIAKTTLQALNHNSDNPILVGKVAVSNFEAARAQVLAGDRTHGGQPSPELIALTQVNQKQVNQNEDCQIGTSIDEQLDFEESNAWIESLEQEINSLSFLDLDLELSLDDRQEEALETLPETLTSPKAEKLDSFDGFDFLGDDSSDQDFDIFTQDLEIDNENNRLKVGIFNDLSSVSELAKFFDPDEALPAKPSKTQSEQSLKQSKTFLKSPSAITSATSPLNDSIADVGKEAPILPSKTTSKKPELATPYISETARVDVLRLERLNNFSSELVTQENASILQNQQLQAKIERLQKQFKGFENLSKNLQTWLDKAQRSQVRTQDFSALSSSLNLSASNLSGSINPLADFDPLQMDSYSRLHNVIQEALEEIAQMDEGMSDMTILMQQTQQTQRRKQQVLKQVRYDLLWSRMLPLGDILNNLPRMVRDMSNKYNKQVSLKLFGTGTLIDKLALEKLYDPFVHLVRNAFDHGTESTQERLDLGKPVIASIEIRAYYRGNQTYIEIKDDGHGIDIEKIKAKAIAVGLLEAAQANQVTNEEIYQFLFAPSFSTADVVSELSGRGMGLSTVQEQVRSLKGAIEVKSEFGQGTTFTIRLPLILSIAKLLIFSIQDRLLAIAINTLLSIFTVDTEAIQIIQGKEFFLLEDRLIPLYPTSIFVDSYPLPKQSLEALSTEALSTEAFPEEDKTTLLLFSNGNQTVALPIDRIINEQELAIKPFGKAITPPSYLYGCTVLGNGTLVPVVDTSALLSLKYFPNSSTSAHSSSAQSSSAQSHTSSKPPELKSKLIQRKTILIVDDSLTTRQALYLTLEKFGYQVIQAEDGREAIKQLSRSPEIQAVLCDIEMPNMSGFEFLTACRQDSHFKDIPIVMLTSRGGQKHRGVAKLLGASGYLTKPYLEQELIQTIQGILV